MGCLNSQKLRRRFETHIEKGHSKRYVRSSLCFVSYYFILKIIIIESTQGEFLYKETLYFLSCSCSHLNKKQGYINKRKGLCIKRFQYDHIQILFLTFPQRERDAFEPFKKGEKRHQLSTLISFPVLLCEALAYITS